MPSPSREALLSVQVVEVDLSARGNLRHFREGDNPEIVVR